MIQEQAFAPGRQDSVVPFTPIGKRTEHQPSTLERVETEPSFQAVCGFELIGVTGSLQSPALPGVTDKVAESMPDQMMSSLVSALGEGQSVSFIYTGGAQRPIQWRLMGTGTSTASTYEANERLLNVQDALRTITESRHSQYRFKALAPEACARQRARTHKWTGQLRPHGTEIPSRKGRVGFSTAANTAPSTSVFMPHYIKDRTRAFSSIISLLGSSRIPLSISITIHACRLTRTDKAALQRALDVILEGDASALPLHLADSIQMWLKVRAGCRVTCAVHANRRISDAFMKMLGGELFYGPVDVLCHRTVVSSTVTLPGQINSSTEGTTVALDLRSCIPATFPIAPLFPEPDTLARQGMRRVFNKDRLVLPSAGLLLGRVSDGQQDQRVHLAKPDRSRHFYVLGATGTGKSTLLHNLIAQDIHNGEGVCLIDPHGDLFDDVVRSIPSHRAKDVVLIDLRDRDRAIGLNVLECSGPHRDVQINFVIGELMALIGKMYDLRVAGGPVFESYFRVALQLVMSDPDNPGTLVDMISVFEDKTARDNLIKKSKDPHLGDFWNMAMRAGGEAAFPNVAPYILSKINRFIHNAMLRPIIGQQQSTVDFRQIMDKRKILLVNLARGALGELDMKLLGTVVLTKLMCAAMSRLDLAPAKRRPFMLYVDEFQNFTSNATGTLLAESRKFGLCLTLANQNLSQLAMLEEKCHVVDSILGNVGSMAFFQLGAPDAEKLSVYTRPTFGLEDLQSLPKYHAAARLLTVNGPTRPFVFETFPAPQSRTTPAAHKRMKANKVGYSKSVPWVEEQIRARREALRTPPPKTPEVIEKEKRIKAILESPK